MMDNTWMAALLLVLTNGRKPLWPQTQTSNRSHLEPPLDVAYLHPSTSMTPYSMCHASRPMLAQAGVVWVVCARVVCRVGQVLVWDRLVRRRASHTSETVSQVRRRAPHTIWRRASHTICSWDGERLTQSSHLSHTMFWFVSRTVSQRAVPGLLVTCVRRCASVKPKHPIV